MAARKVAVFIDAENMSVVSAARILYEAARYGVVRERRLYGDFIRRSHLSSWLEVAPRHALTPRQTAGSAVGKNGADIALVIDAVEMLCLSDVDVFCLATSDGDFTQLAIRIRQDGKTAVGLGQATASLHFKEACDMFIEVVEVAKPAGAVSQSPPPPDVASAQRKLDANLLQRAFIAAPRLDGGDWVGLPDVMKALKVCDPTFDVKAYGHGQLCKLLAFSGVELADKNRKARVKKAMLKKVVDNGQPMLATRLD